MSDFKTGQKPEAKDSGRSAAAGQCPAPGSRLTGCSSHALTENEIKPRKVRKSRPEAKNRHFPGLLLGIAGGAPTRAGRVHELNSVLKVPVPSFFSTLQQLSRAVNSAMEFYLVKRFQVLKKDKNQTLATVLHP